MRKTEPTADPPKADEAVRLKVTDSNHLRLKNPENLENPENLKDLKDLKNPKNPNKLKNPENPNNLALSKSLVLNDLGFDSRAGVLDFSLCFLWFIFLLLLSSKLSFQ